MTARILALDLGAESGRGVVGTLNEGGRLTLSETHRFPTGGVRLGPTLHWDFPRLVEECRTAIAKSREGGPLDSLGVDAWGVDFGLLDARGALVGLPVHYRDSRTDGQVEKTYARMPRSEIFAITGVQTMPINTLFQLSALAERSPRLLEAADSLLFVPDLMHYCLSGERVTEYTVASTSQMLDARAKDWSAALLSRLGLPGRLLQTPAPPGVRVGSHGGVPVIAPGGHDTACAVAAVPALPGDNWAYLSSGTWSLLGVEIDRPILSAEAAAANVTNEGGADGRIRLLKNIAGLWLVQECRRHWATLGAERSYEKLARLAADAPPLAAVVDPDHPSLLAPPDMPEAIRQLCLDSGQTPPEGIGETMRCCLDSLGLKYRRVLQAMETLAGRKIDTLHIVGGGSQNRLLNQIAADATGCTVIAGPVEATAIGNVLLQARSLGLISDLSELRAIVRASFPLETYHPDPQMTERFEQAEARYF